MTTHSQTDDSVVVIIGSGAGGGTLANELCKKGIKVVVLEAGKRAIACDVHQRRMEVLRPAGVAGQAHDVGHLARRQGLPEPAGLDLQDRRRHDHALGGRVAAYPASTSSRRATTYGDIKGANLLDWPLTLKELEPYYDTRRRQDGRDAHQRHAGPAGQQQLQGDVTPAP